MPEAYLARELELDYAAVSVVVNYAAGRAQSVDGIHMDSIQAVLGEVMVQVRHLLEQLVSQDAACAV
jgi:purine nucleoside phosphorylase